LVGLRRGCDRLVGVVRAQCEQRMEETMSARRVSVHRGRHLGWWVEGRWANGRLFMMTWWPTRGLAQAVARMVGARPQEATSGDR